MVGHSENAPNTPLPVIAAAKVPFPLASKSPYHTSTGGAFPRIGPGSAIRAAPEILEI